MRKLVENCVHPFVKNPMNFMNLKGLFLEPVTLPAAPEGGPAVERAESQEQRRRKEQEERTSEGGCQRERKRKIVAPVPQSFVISSNTPNCC